MHAWNRTPSSARADATIWASRMSWKGRTFDSRREVTFSEIHRRVAWGIVGLLDGTRLGSCHHQSLSRGGRHLSIPSHRIDLRNPECHSGQTHKRGQDTQKGSESFLEGPDTQKGSESFLGVQT